MHAADGLCLGGEEFLIHPHFRDNGGGYRAVAVCAKFFRNVTLSLRLPQRGQDRRRTVHSGTRCFCHLGVLAEVTVTYNPTADGDPIVEGWTYLFHVLEA